MLKKNTVFENARNEREAIYMNIYIYYEHIMVLGDITSKTHD